MTEWQKMRSGMMYDWTDPEIDRSLTRSRLACERFNQSGMDHENYREVLEAIGHRWTMECLTVLIFAPSNLINKNYRFMETLLLVPLLILLLAYHPERVDLEHGSNHQGYEPVHACLEHEIGSQAIGESYDVANEDDAAKTKVLALVSLKKVQDKQSGSTHCHDIWGIVAQWQVSDRRNYDKDI